jgi:cytochrome P450
MAGQMALREMWRDRSPLAALRVFHAELGDCFRINAPGFTPVMLAGPDAARFVLVTSRSDLRWRNETDPVTRLLRHGVLVQDGDMHDQLRQIMTPALHKRVLGHYVDAMIRGVDAVTAGWAGDAARDLLPEMRRAALLIIFEALFKHDFAPDIAAMWPVILRTLSYISPGLWMLWRGMPRFGYASRLRQMDAYLYDMIAAYRERSGGEASDLLGMLIASGLGDSDIRDQLLTLLIAGHDTSTASLAWTLYTLGAHPEAMALARAEVDAVIGRDVPCLEHAGQLKYLDQVIKETLRLYPPIHLSSRNAAIDLDFNGFRIPAGTRVLFSIYLTQRDPRHWPDPDRFDSDRFSPENSANRSAYTYLPFGGGPRNCIGYAFAELELRLVLTRLLQRFDFTLTKPGIHVHMGATLEPRPGVMMHITPRV